MKHLTRKWSATPRDTNTHTNTYRNRKERKHWKHREIHGAPAWTITLLLINSL